jgi:DNA-binding response OmpR family regulator
LSRLLLVDDDEDNLQLFGAILTNYNFTVDLFSDPVKALIEFKPNYYDLVILDYLMPSLDGVELYKAIKEKEPAAKIMFLTASHETIKLNSMDNPKIVRKPVFVTKLIQEIKDMLDVNETYVMDSVN